jgi:predicted DNA binding CopG/RHH family protein
MPSRSTRKRASGSNESFRARKNQAISLRLPREDLELTKKRAAEAGVPYQTLISSIIHKYVTDQLYERDEVRKIVRELKGE